MTYLQPHKRPYQRLAYIGAIVAVGVIVACVSLVIFAPHIFSAFFTTVARPFWRVEFSLESGSLRSPEQLLTENEDLRNQLSEAKLAAITSDALVFENTELKALMGRDDISTSTMSSTRGGSSRIGILAAVLRRPPLSLYDELVIDIGADRDISTSSLVYATGNVLIGRVVDVLRHTSKVQLFSSPGEKYEVMIGSTHIPATAIGRGGGQYEAQVSRGSGVSVGDFVSDPSLVDRPFGVVTAVVSDPAQPFEKVVFAPPINIFQLRWVLVKQP